MCDGDGGASPASFVDPPGALPCQGVQACAPPSLFGKGQGTPVLFWQAEACENPCGPDAEARGTSNLVAKRHAFVSSLVLHVEPESSASSHGQNGEALPTAASFEDVAVSLLKFPLEAGRDSVEEAPAELAAAPAAPMPAAAPPPIATAGPVGMEEWQVAPGSGSGGGEQRCTGVAEADRQQAPLSPSIPSSLPLSSPHPCSPSSSSACSPASQRCCGVAPAKAVSAHASYFSGTGPGSEAIFSKLGHDDKMALLSEYGSWRLRRREGHVLRCTAGALAIAAVGTVAALPLSGGDAPGMEARVWLPLALVLALAAAVVEHAPVLTVRHTVGSEFRGGGIAAPAVAAASLPLMPGPHSLPLVDSMPTPWAPEPGSREPHVGVALAETVITLGKFLVFITFACHAALLDLAGTDVSAFVVTSRVCISLHVALCAVLGLLFGCATRCMPTVFLDDRPDGPRNALSAHLLGLGGAIIGPLDVGLRGICRGDPSLDACALAGLCAPARLLAAVTLDVPHLVLGALLFAAAAAADGGQNPGNGAEAAAGEQQVSRLWAARVLGATTTAAAAVGLALAAKVCSIDSQWFWYGSGYGRRRAFLVKKGHASARWSMAQKKLRELKHDRRVRCKVTSRLEALTIEASATANVAG